MPPRTTFLSRLIGIYAILISLSMLTHKRATIEMVTALVHSPPVLYLVGVMLVVAGLAMILVHNIWSGGALPFHFFSAATLPIRESDHVKVTQGGLLSRHRSFLRFRLALGMLPTLRGLLPNFKRWKSTDKIYRTADRVLRGDKPRSDVLFGALFNH